MSLVNESPFAIRYKLGRFSSPARVLRDRIVGDLDSIIEGEGANLRKYSIAFRIAGDRGS